MSNDAQVYYDRARQQFVEKNHNQAVINLTAAIGLRPDWSDAYLYRGMVFWDMGNDSSALQDLHQVIKLAPTMGLPYSICGMIYVTQGNSEIALMYYNKAISLGFEDACLVRGDLHKKAGGDSIDSAFNDFEWLKDNARRPELRRSARDRLASSDFYDNYVNRGAKRISSGEYEQALEDLNHAIELKPKEHVGYYYRAWIYQAWQDTDEAIADYSKAIKLAPKFYAAYFQRGITFASHGKYHNALADFYEVFHSSDPELRELATEWADAVRKLITDGISSHTASFQVSHGLGNSTREKCNWCRGSGSTSCNACDGRGRRYFEWYAGVHVQGEEMCIDCSGTGKVTCRSCAGIGYTNY